MYPYIILAAIAALAAAAVLLIRRCKSKDRKTDTVTIYIPDSDIPLPEQYISENKKDVLVGSLSSIAQLDACLCGNFYHVPAKYVPGDIKDIRYVAIYQSRRFFGSGGGISYYAEVRSAALVPRRAITEIPKNSGEMYVRFDVHSWQRLPCTIACTGKGVVLGYTSIELLENARYLPQLWLDGIVQCRLYAAIDEACQCGSGYCSYYDIETVRSGTKIKLMHAGVCCAAIEISAFRRAPVRTLNYVEKTLASVICGTV